MKIQSVNYFVSELNNQKKRQNYSKFVAPVRCNNFSFRGHDLLDLPEKEVLKKIDESLIPENFLGQGTEAEVYRIKDTNYCVRIPYKANYMYASCYSKEISNADKVNHIVAKLGFGASIMKYFEGETPKRYMSSELYRHQFQEKIAKMPIESYSDLLHQIANGIDNELFFDFSGGNLIVNIEKNKFTVIDFGEIPENPRSVKPLTEMFSVLTCYGTKTGTAKEIAQKVLMSGLEEFRPGNIPCMDVELFDFIDLFKKCGCYHFSIQNFRYIEELKPQINALKKLKKAEVVDRTICDTLEKQLLSIKRIIKKLH